MPTGSKIYFASDFHLGVPDYHTSLAREKKIVAWLETVRHDAAEIFLVGDVFDFWYEYRHVAPKGYLRFLGKIAEITDAGIPVHWMVGNHDMWMFGYLKDELGVQVHMHPVQRMIGGKKWVIGHGDGLGPGDHSYKFIKKIFRNRFFQWVFSRFHPNFAFGLANYFSRRSRKANYEYDARFLGEDKEWLIIYCKEVLQQEHIDYFIFGHRHLVLDIPLPGGSRYINLGDWMSTCHYAVWDGESLQLRKWE